MSELRWVVLTADAPLAGGRAAQPDRAVTAGTAAAHAAAASHGAFQFLAGIGTSQGTVVGVTSSTLLVSRRFLHPARRNLGRSPYESLIGSREPAPGDTVGAMAAQSGTRRW